MLKLTLPEQTSLLSWLPAGFSGGAAWRGLRGLLAEMVFDPLQPPELQALLHDLRALAEPLRAPAPSTLLSQGGWVGRGQGGLSPWERAWLQLDQLRAAGPLEAQAVCERLNWGSHLNNLAMAVLCLEDLAEARALVQGAAGLPRSFWLAHASARDEAPPDPDWVLHLAGRGPLPGRGPAGFVPGLEQALAGRWDEAAAAQEARFRKAYPRAIRQGPQELMQGQLLRQVITHAQGGEPKPKVLEASLEVLFGHWGNQTRSPWWDGTRVAERLPLLALLARQLEREPVELLQAQRKRNEHLAQPPARTFTPPPAVMAALASYEQLLVEALQAGTPVRRLGGLSQALRLEAF